MENLTNANTKIEEQDDSLFSGLPQEYVEKLTPAKSRFIMLYLTGLYSQKKIAQIIGVSETTLRMWQMQEPVQMVMKELQQREFEVIDSKLKAMRYKALNTLDNLLESPDDRVKYSATKDILDRTGHKAAQSIKVDKTVTTIEQQLQQLADFTIDDSEVVDIDDYIEVVTNE